MEIIIMLSKFAWGLIELVFAFIIMGILIEAQNNLIIKNIEKRRTLMLDILEEEIITLNKTQAGEFGSSDVVVEVNRRVNIKHFTNTELLHMAETTIKSLKLKGVL